MKNKDVIKLVKAVAKLRKLHKDFLDNKDYHKLKQAIALMGKLTSEIESIQARSQEAPTYKWQSRFLLVSSEYILGFLSILKTKSGYQDFSEKCHTVDKALDYLFNNELELKLSSL